MRFDHYALVPGPDGTSLVEVDGRAPCVRSDWRVPAVRAAFAPVVGTPTYLRAAAARVELEPDRFAWLHVFDTGEAAGALQLADVDPAHFVPAELRPALERWLAEQRGAPIPALRAAWAQPGWLAQAEAWTGCSLEPVRQWPLSAVLRGELDGEAVFLKAVFPLFHCEPAVTEALAREHRRNVPELIRADHERGWMLMRELPGEFIGDSDTIVGAAAAALRTLAELQRAWCGRTDELLVLGAQDRRVDTAALPLPHTLGHGDFHGHNVAFDGERAVIFDWSDACVTHPLFDLHLFLFTYPEDARDERDRLIDAYAEPWAGIASADELRAGLALAAPWSCLHQAASYAAIRDAVEPDNQQLFGNEARLWRERAELARPTAEP